MMPSESEDRMISVQLAHARRGDAEAMAALIDRFSPALLLAAERRLFGASAGADAEDIVQHVWWVALRRIPELSPVPGHSAATFLRYLTTVLLRHIKDLQITRIRRHTHGIADGSPDTSVGEFDEFVRTTTGAISRVARGETRRRLDDAIAALEPIDREIVVRRAFEDESPVDIGVDLGIGANTVAQRYRRALAKLRDALPASVFADLGDE